MTTTTLSAHDAVQSTLELLTDLLPGSSQLDCYDHARRAILASVVFDAEHNAGRHLRHYAEQLDHIDLLTRRWIAAGNAAELCMSADHWENLATEPGDPQIVTRLDDHIRAHLEA